jgi:hypothetical protein
MVAAKVAVNFRRILIALVALAGLGAYLYFYEVPRAEKEGKKEKLLAVDKDAITGIELVFSDRDIGLSKGEHGWRLTRPIDAPADEATVTALLGAIADAEIQKTLDEAPSDLANFGLDKPNPTVRLTLKSGDQAPPLAIGKNTTIGGKTYIRKGDEAKIYLTASSLQTGLNKQTKDLRDKQILTFQDDDVSRLEITNDHGDKTTLVRKDKDAWTVDPGDHPADVTDARSYLSTLRSLRAIDFPDDAPVDLGKFGLAKPRLTVVVFSGKDDSAAQTLLVGSDATQGTQKQTYVKRADQPVVYAIGDWAARNLGKTANDLRDKTILGFDPARVGRILLERSGGGSVTLVRTGDSSWQIAGQEGKTTKDTAISRFLDDVKDLKGSEIVAEPAKDLKPFGLDAPAIRITLTNKEGQLMGTVLAASPNGSEKKYYAMRSGGEAVFGVRDYMYARLDKQPTDFAEAAPGQTTTTIAPPAPPSPLSSPDDDEPEDSGAGDEEE